MELGLKDGIYVTIYLITVVSLWNGFHNDVVNNSKDINTNAKDIKALSKLFKSILFSESGEMLLTTRNECEKTQIQIEKKFNAGEASSRAAFDKIELMNNNIIAIMTHLEIPKPEKIFKDNRHG